MELVYSCLTSIYQPPDEINNTAFKPLIRQHYNDYTASGLFSKKINVGEKIHISRDNLVCFICETIDELNKRFK